VLSLAETGAMLKMADVAVSGDTGLMHLATAVRTPVIALFGPTVERFGFTPYQSKATLIQRNLPCRPCTSRGTDRCPLGHHNCLRTIQVDEVLSAALKPPR
jgi:heptosyltransferase-2